MIDRGDRHIEDTISTISAGLLAAVRMGDESAWNKLVFIYGRLVYRWCRTRGVSSEDAVDVGQEVFSAVSRSLEKFKREKPTDTFTGWLRRITERKIIDHFRKMQKHGKLESEEKMKALLDNLAVAEQHNDSSESITVDAERDRQELLRRIMEYSSKKFRPSHWKIFWEAVVEQKNRHDLAAENKMKRSNIDLIVSRILARIRNEFATEF